MFVMLIAISPEAVPDYQVGPNKLTDVKSLSWGTGHTEAFFQHHSTLFAKT